MDNTIKHKNALKSSKLATLLTTLGLLIVIASITYSVFELNSLEARIRLKQSELEQIKSNMDSVKIEFIKQKQQLSASRESVYFVTQGINFFHQGLYLEAVKAYNTALSLDSLNAYILNLKGYSLFKAKRYSEAVKVLHHAVEVQPDYAWGYFDLARANCANGNYDNALKAAQKAIELRHDMINTIKNDGEFNRLCKRIIENLNSKN
jgi:tetratricopeptide (TPR) repeat protein